MFIVILLSLLSLLIALLTDNWVSGITLIPLFFIGIKFANDELKAIIGEGMSDILSAGFLFPIFVTVNQQIPISIAVFIFIIVWLLTLKSFLPNWVLSRQRLFAIGSLSGVLMFMEFSLFISILPVLLLTTYKSRKSVKQTLAIITGFSWILLGFLFAYPLLTILMSKEFKPQLSVINATDPSFQYFIYAISIITLLWTINLYRIRRRWRQESRYFIVNMLVFSIISVVMTKFALLPTIVITLPILHVAWNMQVKKSIFSLASVLTIIILVWLNQQYVLNFLNLQH